MTGQMKDYKIIWDGERRQHVLVHIHKSAGWMAACHRYDKSWICCSCGATHEIPEEMQFCADLAGCISIRAWYDLNYGKWRPK